MIIRLSALLRHASRSLMATAGIIAAAGLVSSCKSVIEDDLPECKEGLALRFVYDYNMEFANAFTAQVDCLTVFVYDESGRCVEKRTESGTPLADEAYRMEVDLEPGNYTVLAYGGMDCEQSSFHFTSDPQESLMKDVQVELDRKLLTSPEGQKLHPLFYGTIDTTVESNETLEYKEVTVPMMKDTNNLRIILQQVDGESLDCNRFDWRLTDDNTLMAWNNSVIPTSTVTYFPWTQGNASPGVTEDEMEVGVAFAEFSFPRLVTTNSPKLEITDKETGRTVVSIPLNNYLLLLKSQEFAKMGNQEFLDRESRWNMIFFLDSNMIWLDTNIVINDWVVRINHAEI